MPPSALRHLLLRRLSTSAAPETRTQKLERLADELLSLNRLERFDYNILFHLKTGLDRLAPAASGVLPAAGVSPAGAPAAEAAEKTAFDIKLEKYGADAKIKVIKEVRGFTELGLKEAKDLVEKAPVVIKKGVSKEDAAPILEKLKALGATVSLE